MRSRSTEPMRRAHSSLVRCSQPSIIVSHISHTGGSSGNRIMLRHSDSRSSPMMDRYGSIFRHFESMDHFSSLSSMLTIQISRWMNVTCRFLRIWGSDRDRSTSTIMISIRSSSTLISRIVPRKTRSIHSRAWRAHSWRSRKMKLEDSS